ncbi:hypothetical protein [Paenibacillus harenae]|uniref:hypothetical protein n=1 Tax=Paenibacillus harenae TaxID=306543 RepID=UPI00041A5FE7|nr:hypothetical protein [Paenibacillus harenae]
MPERVIKWLPLFSAVVGGGALWYTWIKYLDMAEPAVPWYGWIRLAFTLLIGVLCLAATVLLLLGKPFGMSVLKGGLTLVPIMLMMNLVILVIRIIQNIALGKAQPFFERIFTEPRNFAIPIIVMSLILLSVISKKEKNKNSH